MVRCIMVLFLSLLLVGTGATARAGNFEIGVTVRVGKRQVSTKQTRQAPAKEELPPRPVLEFDHDEPVQVSWRAVNTSKSAEFKDVLIHFFVVKQQQAGLAEVPRLTKDVTYEGALTMDFDPQDSASWRWTFKIHEPGSYLLRVETIGMLEKQGHEQYAALDLVVR